MQSNADRKAMAKTLQSRINAMQGLGKTSCETVVSALAPFNGAFPDGVFPTGAIHEFTSSHSTDAASTTGFITALTGKIMKEGALCLWIGGQKNIFPVGLKHFGLEPDRVVFIHVDKPRDMLWTIEEALKCEAVTAVIGELNDLGFTESRRLQLAVERSGVTGFIHRIRPRSQNAVASTARWNIKSLPSVHDDLPGLGYSAWDVQLVKVRNGRPTSWQVKWSESSFLSLSEKKISLQFIERQAV